MARQPEPLFSEKAERSTLGSLLIDSHAFLAVTEILTVEDFYLARHRAIYEAMVALFKTGKPVDFVTLSEALERKGKLQMAGGDAYLSDLMVAVPSAVNVKAYAQEVHDLAVRRGVLKLASEAASLAHDGEVTPNEILGRVDGIRLELAEIAERGQSRIKTTGELMSLIYDRAEAIRRGEDAGVVKTGYRDLDRYLGGWRAGAIYTVAARPGIGKTSLKLCFAKRAALQGHWAAFFALEMADEEIASRLLSMHGAASVRDINNGAPLRDEQWIDLADKIGKISELPILVDDTPSLSLSQLRAKATRLKLEGKLDIVFVDYLQLMTIEVGHGVKRYRELGLIMHGLKDLAKELRVPIVVGAQLGRAAEGKEPTLADLRESGDIENDSDGVLFIHRERAVNTPVPGGMPTSPGAIPAKLILAKHRHGPEGVVDMYWVPKLTAFVGANEPLR